MLAQRRTIVGPTYPMLVLLWAKMLYYLVWGCRIHLLVQEVLAAPTGAAVKKLDITCSSKCRGGSRASSQNKTSIMLTLLANGILCCHSPVGKFSAKNAHYCQLWFNFFLKNSQSLATRNLTHVNAYVWTSVLAYECTLPCLPKD